MVENYISPLPETPFLLFPSDILENKKSEGE